MLVPEQRWLLLHARFTSYEHVGAAALHFAPLRFLSHAVPAGTIADSYAEALVYVFSILHAQGDRALYTWALRTRDDLKPFVWLLLAAAADVPSILRVANVQLAP